MNTRMMTRAAMDLALLGCLLVADTQTSQLISSMPWVFLLPAMHFRLANGSMPKVLLLAMGLMGIILSGFVTWFVLWMALLAFCFIDHFWLSTLAYALGYTIMVTFFSALFGFELNGFMPYALGFSLQAITIVLVGLLALSSALMQKMVYILFARRMGIHLPVMSIGDIQANPLAVLALLIGLIFHQVWWGQVSLIASFLVLAFYGACFLVSLNHRARLFIFLGILIPGLNLIWAVFGGLDALFRIRGKYGLD